MSRTIDTLLLLALPASGKSELRRYLGHLDPEVAARDLHLGPVVQLDDYPYVHMMRRISEELAIIDEPTVFFQARDRPFSEPRDWGTLIHLLNEDYAALGSMPSRPESAALWLFDRLDRARGKAGVTSAIRDLAFGVRERLAGTLEDEAAELWSELSRSVASWRDGSTVVIEFARGGPAGAGMPLAPPHGYAHALAELADDIRDRASILYVRVTPEESRRKNEERAKPGRDGDASVLFHGVPEAVMREEYGVDDFNWLLDKGGGRSITIGGDGTEWVIPVAVFDNRTDRTSFLRGEPDEWPKDDVAALHATLIEAFDKLAG